MSKISDAELHDYIDGELDAAEMEDFEQRLDAAGRARLNELQQLRRSLGDLPKEAIVPPRLWSGIEARIADASAVEGAPSQTDPDVVPLHSKRAGGGSKYEMRNRLIAASIALVALAGAYWLGTRNPQTTGPVQTAEVDTAPPAVEFAGDGGGSVLTDDVIDTFVAASAELEAVLREGADRLQPDTREVLENSLATIDAAIAEAREALANDPGSPLVERRLVQALQFKLGVLRQGVSAVQRAT